MIFFTVEVVKSALQLLLWTTIQVMMPIRTLPEIGIFFHAESKARDIIMLHMTPEASIGT